MEIEKNKIKGYVGLANKANSVKVGFDKIKLSGQIIKLCLISKLASDNLKKEIKYLSQKHCFEVYEILNEDLVTYINIVSCKVIGITNEGLAKEIIKLLNKEQKWE